MHPDAGQRGSEFVAHRGDELLLATGQRELVGQETADESQAAQDQDALEGGREPEAAAPFPGALSNEFEPLGWSGQAPGHAGQANGSPFDVGSDGQGCVLGSPGKDAREKPGSIEIETLHPRFVLAEPGESIRDGLTAHLLEGEIAVEDLLDGVGGRVGGVDGGERGTGPRLHHEVLLGDGLLVGIGLRSELWFGGANGQLAQAQREFGKKVHIGAGTLDLRSGDLEVGTEALLAIGLGQSREDQRRVLGDQFLAGLVGQRGSLRVEAPLLILGEGASLLDGESPGELPLDLPGPLDLHLLGRDLAKTSVLRLLSLEAPEPFGGQPEKRKDDRSREEKEERERSLHGVGPPNWYPLPRTVTTMAGAAGSTSIFRRRRAM